MIRIAIGVVIGVFIAKPVNKLIDEHLTPPVRQKIKESVNKLAARLNETIARPPSV